MFYSCFSICFINLNYSIAGIGIHGYKYYATHTCPNNMLV